MQSKTIIMKLFDNLFDFLSGKISYSEFYFNRELLYDDINYLSEDEKRVFNNLLKTK